jgi:integrase/recombinase XerC
VKLFNGYTKTLGFRVIPHTMRHTFAAHLAEKNMPQSYIQDLLGHVDINSTRIYTRLDNHARKKQYDQYQT